MDNLLMAVSPMFCQRFQRALYDKLESVHRSNIPSSTQEPTQQQLLDLDQTISQQVLEELQNWMH